MRLWEQRPVSMSPAHHTDKMAELVCSNSLKSMREDSAAGLLKIELQMMGSRLLEFAKQAAVPAGGALAVDRDEFSGLVTAAIEGDPRIEVVRQELTAIPEGRCVVAAGPLCSDALFEDISRRVGGSHMAFFDAAAPVVDAESLDRGIVFEQSRYGEEGRGDYLNCPMEREEYDAFYDALVSAERVIARDFEQSDLFCACQPAEEVARTGRDSLRFGALKPVGLTDPRTGRRPWAAVQLRAENRELTAYTMVGFQSPHVLDGTFAIPGTSCRLAGQITGTEGYTEAVASGLLAALNTYADIVGAQSVALPRTGALGSLVAYATDPETKDYQPMHVNFGLVPPIEGRRLKKKERYAAYSARARRDMETFVRSRPDLFAARGA